MVQIIAEIRLGKKNTIYLPKDIVNALKLKEGDKLILKIVGDKIVIEKSKSFFEKALESRKIIELTPEEVEKASVEMQKKLLGDTLSEEN